MELTPEVNEARREGMRMVLDWLYSHGYAGGPIEYSDGIKARFDPPWDELQTLLKELNGQMPE